jgi:hypothetical protein
MNNPEWTLRRRKPMRSKHASIRMLTYLWVVAASGCSSIGSRVECDCATGKVQVTSPIPVVQIESSGAPCPTQPFCERPLDGGACDVFEILLTAAGTCHIVATAADGRQTAFDEKVTLGAVGGCCGPIYQGNAAQITLFPPTDASAP